MVLCRRHHKEAARLRKAPPAAPAIVDPAIGRSRSEIPSAFAIFQIVHRDGRRDDE